MAKVRLAVVGSLNYDLFAYVPHLARPGEAVPAREVRRALGGKGFNQAVAATRLGAAVEMIGAIGDDDFGAAFERRLDELRIGRRGTRRLDLPTGLAMISVDDRGENTIVLSAGANAGLLAEMLDRERLESDVLLVQGELRPETTLRALELGRGVKVLNCAPASVELVPALPLADVVVVNEVEAADMGGADRLRDLGAPAVVVTLGARGAMIDGMVIPAPRVRAIDSTGAGDAFCAALGIALAEGRDLAGAIAWANRAGAAATRRLGASTGMPTRAELKRVG